MAHERLQEQVLAFCNRVRVNAGKKPLKKLPKGRPEEPESCPVARALNFDARVLPVSVKTAHPQLREALSKTTHCPASSSFPLPKYVTRFIGLFDRLEIPELIKK